MTRESIKEQIALKKDLILEKELEIMILQDKSSYIEEIANLKYIGISEKRPRIKFWEDMKRCKRQRHYRHEISRARKAIRALKQDLEDLREQGN